MYNLYPGQGLGYSGPKQMAFGLGTVGQVIIEVAVTTGRIIGSRFRKLIGG